jgi:general secretion pathway protein E
MNAAAFMAVDAHSLALAREQAATQGGSTLEALERLCAMEPRALLQAVSQLFDMPVMDHTDLAGWTPRFDLIPLSVAQGKTCAYFAQGRALVAAIADPTDLDLVTWMESRSAQPARMVCVLAADLQAVLAGHEVGTRALDGISPQSQANQNLDPDALDLSLASISNDATPAVRVVNSTLYDALKAGASDIHFERAAHGLAIKYRIDGVLDLASDIAGSELSERVLSRIKVMAELDISEQRVPQDGRFRVSLKGRLIDVRVSVMPGAHGEDAVLRLLDKQAIVPEGRTLSLELLGFDSHSLASVRSLARQPYGMLLVTGPTGSGKTTTLYGALSEINDGRTKIITIEDPVEYELAGVLQIPVNERKGLTFARGLRSILRHDPDKIMVGEIRDAETAEIAVQSALTGHLVFSTVHANNAFDVFNRFSHMGIDPYAFTSALNGIWAQRLLRRVCPRCSKPHAPSAGELQSAGLSQEQIRAGHLVRGTGCGDCRGTGYKGRLAIAEVLLMNDRLRQMVSSRAPIEELKHEARRTGTRYLREIALDLALAGETTLEEVCRVTLEA